MTCGALSPRSVIRQDSDIFTVPFVDNVGDPIDITGWEVRFTVRTVVPATTITDDTDAAVIISAEATIPTGTDGLAEFNISPTDTDYDPGEYVYDIQYKKTTGAIKSLAYSTYTITADITRDT